MKKLYKKGKVHPTPPTISDHLAFLPATILALTVALSPEDREVLAYLISCSGAPGGFSGGRRSSSGGSSADHVPMFQCDCFRCYMSYWVRWDASPNRQLIHDVIDAFEEELSKMNSKKGKIKGKKEKKMKMKMMKPSGSDDSKRNIDGDDEERLDESSSAVASSSSGRGVLDPISAVADHQVEMGGGDAINGDGEARDAVADGVEEVQERGSVRRFVSFIGEKIWGVWG